MLHQSPKRRLLALLLALSLLVQMGAPAWAAESSVDQEGMLSAQETVSQEAEEGEKAEAEETVPQPEQQEEDAPEAEEAQESENDTEGALDVDTPEFWEEFREEYAEDGDYLKRYEQYQDQGVKRAFENDDDIPGTIEAMSEEELAVQAASGTTKSPFTNKTYTHASMHSGKTVALGIDVSKWQYSIDWKKVKAAGVKFAFIRCGFTNLSKFNMNKDDYFEKNVKNAYDAGVKVGIYYFSQAVNVTEATKEAKKTIEFLKPYKSMISLPVAMDYERVSGGRINKVSKANGTEIMKTFCKTIQSGGYDAFIYANSYDLTTFCDVSQVKDYGYWYAWYSANDKSSKPVSPSFTGKAYDFWQYSAKGKVNGISGSVDCNFWYQGKGSGTVSSSTGKPAQVTGLKVTEIKETSLGLKWTAVDNAQKYNVEGMTSGASYTTLATPVGNTCGVTGLTPGTTYTIRVKAVNTKGTGTASAAIKVTTKGTAQSQNRTDLPAPELVSATSSLGGVKVKWNAVEGAQLYRVLRKSEGSDWTAVQETTKLSWLDTAAQSGTAYTYSVRCINDTDKSDAGSMDEAGLSVVYYAAPTVKKAEVKSSGVKVSWDAVPGASQYRLFRKVGDGKWQKVADTGEDSYMDTEAQAGTVYRYTVRCISEDAASYISYYDANGVELCVLSAPKLSSVKNSKKKTLTARWAKVSGAGGYQVRCVLGSSSKKKSVSGGSKTSGSVKSLKKKKTYTVSVRAWKKVNGTTWYSAWSSKKKVKVKK